MIFDREWLGKEKNAYNLYEAVIEKIVHERFYAEIHLSPSLYTLGLEGVNERSILILKLQKCVSLTLIPDEDLMRCKDVVTPESADGFLGIEVITMENIEGWTYLKISCFDYEISIVCKDIELHV